MLSEFLDSINKTKQNLIRNSDSREAAERLYNKEHFVIMRSLSYHPDCISLVNELNIRGLDAHDLSGIQRYEFLLNVLDKRNRWAKWGKKDNDELVSIVMQRFNYSMDKAKSAIILMNDQQKQQFLKEYDEMKGYTK